MIKLTPVHTLAELHPYREQYFGSLPYSQGLNTEENVWGCNYYKIQIQSAFAGYVCIDAYKTLWEFYLVDWALIDAQEVFKFLKEMGYMVAAESKTYDHLLMSLCLDGYQTASCNAYLFREDTGLEQIPEGLEKVIMRLATQEDIEALAAINRFAEGVDFFFDLKEEIQKKEVFVFHLDEELLGAGVCKRICPGLDYYDIGMIVPEKHRRKGLGTFIIYQLKLHCYLNHKVPVCDCYYFNIPSKKTLEKAGFVSKHRMVRFEF